LIRSLIILILVSFSFAVQCQTDDAGLWVGFSLDLDLKKKFHAGLDLQSRWNENISEAKTNFIQPWVSKDWTKNFSTSFSYRLSSRRNLDNFYEGRDRANLDLKYKTKLKDLKLQYRLRVQRQLGVFDSERGLNAKIGHRHRLKFGYGVSKKVNVSVLGESFFSADKTGLQTLTDLRFKTSARYKVKKRNYLNLNYIIQREFNKNNPLREYILAIGYVLVLK